MLGVLSAINAALCPLGAGTAGIETVFFLLVLAGRVFGPGFGFPLGSTSLFASALLTAGVGPWLPFQMLAASWVGLGAGLLPRHATGRAEVAMLAVYAAVSAYAYGFCVNIWFWPFSPAADTQRSYVAGAPLSDKPPPVRAVHRHRVVAGWDTGRAITNAIAVAILGSTVLADLDDIARVERGAGIRRPLTRCRDDRHVG